MQSGLWKKVYWKFVAFAILFLSTPATVAWLFNQRNDFLFVGALAYCALILFLSVNIFIDIIKGDY